MTWYKHNSRATVVLLFLFCVTPQLATASPLTEQRLSDDLGDTPPPSEIPQLDGAENAKVPEVTQAETGLTEMSPEDEDELFKDVDPKTLAAVLLQALNRPGDEKKSSRLEERAEGKENEKGEEEREEEERLTEKVKSRTTSQTMPVKDQSEQEVLKEPETKEEEQLSSQEMKKLQTMLEELHHFSTTTKREWDSVGQRESRGSYTNTDKDFLNNDIDIKPKGYNPEEEEARAKAEQEEVRRQAAEAQRAKAEEEKLADIASDMLLQYMVKPDVKQNQDQAKKAFLGNNVAEDKRSDEEDNSNDEDDIDPQTIDKLIEISSKLHLPADDVVDIISDVERKKKKDLNRPSKPWLQEKFPVKQIKQDFGPKPQKQIWTYPSNKFYQKPLRSMDYGFDFSPKQKRNFYLPKYVFPNPRTFKQVPMPKPRSPPPTPMILRDEDYYSPVGQLAKSDQNLENFIQKVFLKRPRLFQ
uniref:VGF nerve growth factor inducible n=1 Tax=Paramormyrops kingsleyae TaxID=1676925 RepID=A0A3B3RPC2_9TELE